MFHKNIPCKSGDLTKVKISGRMYSEILVRATGCNLAMVVRSARVS